MLCSSFVERFSSSEVGKIIWGLNLLLHMPEYNTYYMRSECLFFLCCNSNLTSIIRRASPSLQYIETVLEVFTATVFDLVVPTGLFI